MSHPKEEKTVLLIKPDGVKRTLVGEIIKRLETRGLKIVGLRMVWPGRDHFDNHYPKDKSWIKRLGEKTLEICEEHGIDPKKQMDAVDPMEIGEQVRQWQINFMTSGPVVKTVIEGVHAISTVRKIVGATMPSTAETGTIRGDFSVDSSAAANYEKRAVQNLIHASENLEEVENELRLWFIQDEIHNYKRFEEEILY